MKKTLRIICAVLLAAFTLGACSITGEPDFKGHTKEDLESSSLQMIEQLQYMSADDLKTALESFNSQKDSDPDNASTYDMYIEMMENWLDITPSVGEFKSYGDFTVEKTGKTVTTKQIIHFAKRDVRFVIVYNYLTMKPTAMNAEIIYSLGELMEKAFMNLLMGMGIVFVVLILIAFIIAAFNIFPYLEKRAAEKKSAESQAQPAVVAAAPVSQASATDDLELVAVITAAIAASTGASTDSFVVRSIKRRF